MNEKQAINNWVEPDWEYLFWAWDLEKEWRKSLPKFTERELLDIFPETKEIIPDKITEWEEERREIIREIKTDLRLINQRSSDEFTRWFHKYWLKQEKGEKLVKVEDHIQKLKNFLWVMKDMAYPSKSLTTEQVEEALRVPIETIISQKFRRSGKALVGLCPLHNEKHPSFYVYPETNRWWCYGGCGGGDVINLLRELHGYSFKEAVQYLIKI